VQDFASYFWSRVERDVDKPLSGWEAMKFVGRVYMEWREARRREELERRMLLRRGRRAASKGARKLILERDGYRCTRCGASDTILHIHHIIPFSEGGSNAPENLATLCIRCHAEEHSDNLGIRSILSNWSPPWLQPQKGEASG